MKRNLLLSTFPPVHLATMEWRDGNPRALRDHSQNVLYMQRGNDGAQLFVVSEMYDTEPAHLVDVNLQSWTFGLRKAYTLEGSHYVFWCKEYNAVAVMTAKHDSDRPQDQTFIPLRLKPRPRGKGKEPFRDLITLPGDVYFERLINHFAQRP